ncbi:MAG TPA: ribulose-phosphate 3-epimerase [Planctomycetota bacterium]|nr:ribulose-phosphate 3-epimerase [Planctomycetota bacterium]
MKTPLIAPSVISADFTRLKDELQAVEAAGADWLHVDVMDGDFVPNITLGPFIVEAIKRLTRLPLDCHLMIQKPERYVEAFAKAGAASITIHPEANGDIHGALDLIRKCGVKPSIALKPATPVSAASDYISQIEMLLVMTVNPGFSGQKMITECLPKYAEARKLFGENLLLEIDGGVTPQNAQAVRDAGAQVIVAATSIFKSGDYATAIRELRGA